MQCNLNEGQQAAIRHMENPCLVLSGPGSGKTTVIVERICRLLEKGIPAGNIMVLTFTRAAAAEMRERFFKRIEEYSSSSNNKEQLGPGVAGQVRFGTFHSVAFQILRYSGEYDGTSVLKNGEKQAILEEVSHATGIHHDREGWYQEVLQEISQVKGEGKKPEAYASVSCDPQEFQRLFYEYQKILDSRKKLDFDDMLLCCLTLLKEKPDILQIWQERCEYLLIDEYQDSNPIQCELAQLLAAPQNNVMAVGDDDQSIYGFRGASPDRMKAFLEVYPYAEVYRLNINYRCPAEVVEAAGRLISRNKNRMPKEIVAGRKQCPEQKENPPTITADEYGTLKEENQAILNQMQAYHQGGMSYKDMAVLYRTNRNPMQLIRWMEERGIPYTVKGNTGSWFTHWICQDFYAYLAVAAGSSKRAHWLRVICHPERYISRSSLGQEPITIDHLLEECQGDPRKARIMDRLSYDLTVLGRTAPYAAIQYLRRHMGYDAYLRQMDSQGEGGLEELAEWIHETTDGCRSSREWLRYVDQLIQEEKNKTPETKDKTEASTEDTGVNLMTIHGAKGLEYPVVFIIDANEGILPYQQAVSLQEMEEERRLFYVAMTRTGESLHISWTKERFQKTQEVSRFVREAGLLKTEKPQDEKKKKRRFWRLQKE